MGKFYADAAAQLRHMQNPDTGKAYTLAERKARFGIDQTTMNHLDGKRGHVTGEELLNVLFALLSDGKSGRSLYRLASVLDSFRQCRMEVFGDDAVFPLGVKSDLLKLVITHNENVKK